MRVPRLVAAVMVIALVAGLAGCQEEVVEPTLTPTVEPPVIAEAGVLKVGVDLAYPPFGGIDGGVNAGIDVDVAAAIAERLGCRLEVVDVRPAGMASALASRTVDIMLGAVPITEAVLADVATAGSYIIDGPAFFTRGSAESSETVAITLEQVASLRVGAQRESAAFWALEQEFGEGAVIGFDTLRDAFGALDAGEVDVVASSATVGAYIARDYAGVGFAGQFGDAQPLGVALPKDSVELETAVREALDGMAADGVLETIRRKWVGDLPQLTVPAATE
ncbi:MAG: amino acid ABC transporter substrate-binding protein [Coriobacteriia bacterium]|nr:amino acid ABC transporter substrate-binding protein [Coriobacteriia bacterium]